MESEGPNLMQKTDSAQYQRLLQLVGIPSVSPSSVEENRIARAIYDELARMEYFESRPVDLRLLPVEGDPLERHMVFAVVRAPEDRAETVLLTGHMDVVNAEPCGALKELAFSPEAYTGALDPGTLSAEARMDLLSGEWLFGRGVSDMKAGVAACLTRLAEAAADPSSLKANLAVLFVPDEETNSEGMLGAVPWLVRLQEEGFRFLACVNTEPTFATGQEARPTVYLGTIGKINPFFLCLGVETHVGEYYEGFSAGAVVSQINLALDGNVDLADSLDEVAYPPFACLKIRDMRRQYDATILTRCAILYSYLTASRLPGRLLDELKGIATKALNRAIERHNRNRRAFYQRNRTLPRDMNLKGQVFTLCELVERFVSERDCDVREIWNLLALGQEPLGDIRDQALDLVSRLVDELDLSGPLVVLGFLPPWYPHRVNSGSTAGDRMMALAVDELTRQAAESGMALERRPFFEGVCDLSYCGFTGDPSDVKAFFDNMPGGKAIYRFPAADLVRLDIPIVNFGPVGKDAHKATERLHLPFYLDDYPRLLQGLIDAIAEGGV